MYYIFIYNDRHTLQGYSPQTQVWLPEEVVEISEVLTVSDPQRIL